MRSRDMMAKLDRLETSDADDDVKVWDLSLLSPADQDRARDLLRVISEAVEKDDATGMGPIIAEFDDLVRDLPLLGRDDPEQGPPIRVPHDLATYWSWRQSATNWRSYHFDGLSKVQTLRFVELCEHYGYEENLGVPALKSQMIPLTEWQADDQQELRELLEIVGSGRPRRF